MAVPILGMKFLKNLSLRFWVIFSSVLIIFIFSWFRLFSNYEAISYDLRLKLRPAIKVSSDIIIIQISDDTLTNLGKWPLPRDFHASLIDVLKEKGARMVVLDLLFSEPNMYDDMLAKSIKDSANVYMSKAFDEPYGKLFPLKSNAIVADLLETFQDSCGGVGFINTFLDPDGKVRKTPLFIKYKDELFVQLAVNAACSWLGLDTKKIRFTGSRIVIDDKLSLPVLPDGSLLVNYPGKWDKSFKHVSYYEILKAYADEKQGVKPRLDLSILKDKVCFVGLTATGTSDFRANPLENNYPMLGLHASIFNSILSSHFIIPASLPVNTFMNIIIFIFSLVICLHFTPLKAFVSSISLALIYLIVATTLLTVFAIWIDLFLPLLIIAATYIGSTSYRFFNETKKRQLLEKELDIARAIQKSFLPRDLKQFSGISISSFMQPAKFVAGDLYDIAVIHGGKIGVFIGDVSGKGVPASLIMAQTISLFRVFAHQFTNASEVLNRLNKELCGRFEGRFVTCLYMIIDPEKNKVQVSSAGHAPVFLYQKDSSKILEVELDAGMPIGIVEEMSYDDITFDLGRNDKVIVFTDGLSEARSREGVEFQLNNIKKIILSQGEHSSDKILKALKEELFRFTLHAVQHDDITIIVLANRKEN